MPLVTLSDLACCGRSFGLADDPPQPAQRESGGWSLLLFGVATMAVIGAGVLAGRAVHGALANPPRRRNVIYGGMGNVRCIQCKQLKSYDDMAQAPGSAVRDDRDGQYYGLCKDCHRDQEILRAVFASSPKSPARRSARKGAKAAKKSSKAKAKRRNDDKKPPSIAELMKQSYDRHAAVRGAQQK